MGSGLSGVLRIFPFTGECRLSEVLRVFRETEECLMPDVLLDIRL